MTEQLSSSHIRIGVQERSPKYGKGDTKRVFETGYGDWSFGVNLGDIAQAPTDALMCPSTPWLEIGGGAVENVIADAMGEKNFESSSKAVQYYLLEVLKSKGFERAATARLLADYLQTTTGLHTSSTPEEIASGLILTTHLANLKGVGEHVELAHGAAVPLPSGNLKVRGIDVIIMVNVTPSGRSMNVRDMVGFTANACRVANLTGAHSITIPAVGTGFAAAFGFGLSRDDSMKGFFIGAETYAKEAGNRANLKQIDYNIYARASEENAKAVAEMVTGLGLVNKKEEVLIGETGLTF